MKYFFMVLLVCGSVFGAGGPYSSYDDFGGVERHDEFMAMTRGGDFESAQNLAQSEFARLEARLDADEENEAVPLEWSMFNVTWRIDLENNKTVRNYTRAFMHMLISQRGEIVQRIKASVSEGFQDDVLDHEKIQISGLDDHINAAFTDYADAVELEHSLSRGRYIKAQGVYPVLYSRNVWNMEKDLSEHRKVVLSKFESVVLPKSDVVLEEHRIQGMKIAKNIYEQAGARWNVAYGSDTFDLPQIKRDIIAQMAASRDYANRVELCRIHGIIDEFPMMGMLDYIALQLSAASPEERKTMVSQREVLRAHKPAIERFFEQLYPGAILYHIFVTKEVMPQVLFSGFIAELKDCLGWKLPSGL